MSIEDSQVANPCLDAGTGNIGNGQNDDFLNGGNASGWTDITSSVAGAGFTQGGNTGTWNVGDAFSLFDSVAIGFKFGTGNQANEWFVYEALIDSGTWMFNNVFNRGGGLSHINIYGMDAPRDVPEPGTLGLFAIALLGLALRQRLLRTR
jgi:hypothetical protein